MEGSERVLDSGNSRSIGPALIGFIVGVIFSFVAGISLGTISSNNQLLKGEASSSLSSRATQSEKLIAQGSVVSVAKKFKSSVVSIQTRQENGSYSKKGVRGVGSGVVFRRDGYILTNEHVVSGANDITVTGSGKKFKGKIVGTDAKTDIAVIKIEAANLEVAKFGSAKDLKVGELAVAIGSPFGFPRSVTAGVISALNRTVSLSQFPSGTEFDLPRTYTNLIQTDAAINPGNSGGALSNRQGEVVGINTLIYSTNGVSQGIGFAIPIDLAKEAAEEIIAKNR